ncbi:MAG: urease accessory UreF family protein [Burkholderiales bacterium]
MTEIGESLALLQLGDSFFPSGAASFSWGLETLRAEGLVNRAGDVESLIAGQLTHRWAGFDRVAVAWAHRAAGDLDRVLAVDRAVDAATLAREGREGARRIGAALLNVHIGMETPGCAEYRAAVQAGAAFAQMAAVQGHVGQALGIGEAAACAMSAYGLAVSMAGAALRVGLIGHVEVQRVLSRQRTRIAALVAEPVPALDTLCAYTPMAEIAMMRHETGSGRLFAS